MSRKLSSLYGSVVVRGERVDRQHGSTHPRKKQPYALIDPFPHYYYSTTLHRTSSTRKWSTASRTLTKVGSWDQLPRCFCRIKQRLTPGVCMREKAGHCWGHRSWCLMRLCRTRSKCDTSEICKCPTTLDHSLAARRTGRTGGGEGRAWPQLMPRMPWMAWMAWHGMASLLIWRLAAVSAARGAGDRGSLQRADGRATQREVARQTGCNTCPAC